MGGGQSVRQDSISKVEMFNDIQQETDTERVGSATSFGRKLSAIKRHFRQSRKGSDTSSAGSHSMNYSFKAKSARQQNFREKSQSHGIPKQMESFSLNIPTGSITGKFVPRGSPTGVMSKKMQKKKSNSYVMLRVPTKEKNADSENTMKFRTKVLSRDEVVRQVNRNAKTQHKRKGNVKLVMDFIDQDTLKLKFSKDEMDKLTEFFRYHCDDKENDTMSKQVFLYSFRNALQKNTKIGALKDRDLEDRTLETLFDSLDGDDSGQLTLIEFLKGFSYWRSNIAKNQDKILFFFRVFDLDQNNVLSYKEFCDMVHYIVLIEFNRTGTSLKSSRVVQDFIDHVYDDVKDPLGCVSLEKYKNWLEVNQHSRKVKAIGGTLESFITAFELYDHFGTGILSRKAFKGMIKSTQLHATSRAHSRTLKKQIDSYCLEIFKELGRDAEGAISFEEFRTWLLSKPNLAFSVTSQAGYLTEVTYNLQKVGLTDSSIPSKVKTGQEESEQNRTLLDEFSTLKS